MHFSNFTSGFYGFLRSRAISIAFLSSRCREILHMRSHGMLRHLFFQLFHLDCYPSLQSAYK